jgi:hypothetical protein
MLIHDQEDDMAAPNWTTLQVPGSLAVTGDPRDTASHLPAAGGRCPRCERMQWEQKCPGFMRTPVHLGN